MTTKFRTFTDIENDLYTLFDKPNFVVESPKPVEFCNADAEQLLTSLDIEPSRKCVTVGFPLLDDFPLLCGEIAFSILFDKLVEAVSIPLEEAEAKWESSGNLRKFVGSSAVENKRNSLKLLGYLQEFSKNKPDVIYWS